MKTVQNLILITVLTAFLGVNVFKVDEGHIGVVYNFGKVQESYYEPGYHLGNRFTTDIEQVQVNVQTDQVINIQCGTSGGILILFEQIEVVNKLHKEHAVETLKNYGPKYDQIWIFDKIHHEINQFCSKNSLEDIYINKFEKLDEDIQLILQEQLKKWVPGLEILSIRITKPQLPRLIQENFEQQEQLKVEHMKIMKQKDVKIQNLEGELNQQIIQAQSDLQVKRIDMEKKIKQKEAELEKLRIKNQIYLDSQKQKVDSRFYQQSQELDLLDQKLSQSYLNSILTDSLTTNLKAYLGESIPTHLYVGDKKENVQLD